MTILFTDPVGAQSFYSFARKFFYGSLDGSGAELELPRVHLKGMRAGESPMLEREAAKLGGRIELTTKQPTEKGDQAHA